MENSNMVLFPSSDRVLRCQSRLGSMLEWRKNAGWRITASGYPAPLYTLKVGGHAGWRNVVLGDPMDFLCDIRDGMADPECGRQTAILTGCDQVLLVTFAPAEACMTHDGVEVNLGEPASWTTLSGGRVELNQNTHPSIPTHTDLGAKGGMGRNGIPAYAIFEVYNLDEEGEPYELQAMAHLERDQVVQLGWSILEELSLMGVSVDIS